MPDSPRTERDRIAFVLAGIAARAGVEIMDVYNAHGSARLKRDGSPVTDADERAEALIVAELHKQFPGVPVIAEEAASRGDQPSLGASSFFLVDPLDGTKEFVSRNGEFTVNIALIEQGVPIAGVVFAPSLGNLYLGGERASVIALISGQMPDNAAMRTIVARPVGRTMTAIVSRSHGGPDTEAFLRTLPIIDRRSIGSSLKFCLLASGEADVYPRLSPTMEWDTAAGHAVLRASGGDVVGLDQVPLRYGKLDAAFRNPSFIAWGRRDSSTH